MSIPNKNGPMRPWSLYFALGGAVCLALVGAILGITGLLKTEYKSLPPISHAVHLGLVGAIAGAFIGTACGFVIDATRALLLWWKKERPQ